MLWKMGSMSRRFPRIKARLSATVRVRGAEQLLVCPTRDISQRGLFLETAEPLAEQTELEITFMDRDMGEVVELCGAVVRLGPRGVGVSLIDPPDEWVGLIARFGTPARRDPRSLRLRVLVVGEDSRQRGALALYVTSGWDVRFASDLGGATEALHGVTLNAVVVEHDLEDERWAPIMQAARSIQPHARRIVRCAAPRGPLPSTGTRYDLVHRVVDRNAGLDALLDAVTAKLGRATAAPSSD
jgi:hypothetical protein